MKAKDIRRKKLGELVDSYGSIKALAKAIDPSAKYLDRFYSQVLTGVRELGDAAASKIEAKLRKPSGWMDTMATSSREADELLRTWGQFPAEEQRRILEELKIRLRVLNQKTDVKQGLVENNDPTTPRKQHLT